MDNVKSLTDIVDCLYSSKRKKQHPFCEICKLDFNLSLVSLPNKYVCSEFCRREFLAKFYKQIKCRKCSTIISLKNNVYMGQDNTFCSENCRLLFLRKTKFI